MAKRSERDTKELIRELKSKRKRRKVLGTSLKSVGALVIIAAIIVGIVLAADSLGSKSADSTVAGFVRTSTTKTSIKSTTTASSTTERPSTTERRASSTTSTEPSTTTLPPSSTTTTNWLAGKVVVIDPGHQGRGSSAAEQIGPGSTKTKSEVSSGTASPFTGTAESVVTLAVGLKLQAALKALGIQVVMTRTTQNVDVSNIQRAKIANAAHADLAIRLHCNGSTNRSVHGLFTLYPASIRGWTDDIAAPSKRAAAIIQKAAIAATGAQDRGLEERSDLTGFNWSDVPVTLVEMGFMTNAAEDKLLESGTYQDKIVQGLVNGIVEFLRAG
jgi:N-acetylmuramoyl-L-alanine amidase